MDGESRNPVPWWRRWAYALGVLLVLLAGAMAWPGVDLTALKQAPGWSFFAIGGLVLLNLVLTAALFWSVTKSFDAQPPVPLGRMTTLIALSGLLNYIPVIRAGLWGRAAYLKARHGLPVHQSVEILGVVLALAVLVLGGVSVGVLVFPAAHRWLLLAGLLLLLTAATPILANAFFWRPIRGGWVWVPLRTLDLAVTAGRLWLALWVLGVQAGPGEVLLLASGSLLVKLTGLTPNGLGLSEWAVAAMSAELTDIAAPVAAGAALLDRGIEVLVSLTAGGVAAWVLSRDRGSAEAVSPDAVSAQES